ncbi:hypothetical protein LZK98_11610 [Sphingomonas cannabina]|uniref:lysozyme n=1 Tax=Sphingomonas cannabina TaxID=2899123 RepID=UPI001F4209D6|nr:hypothetical protein [Sphingomonas cannabina]UIJ43737.1 hypothetical protein LZK98_11610 [Sphingomonas cannabina]
MTNHLAAAGRITVPVALEIAGHEALVQEAYLDSVKVWTWGIGVTDKSGHRVQRYKDNPQPIARCVEVFIWLLRTKYLPEVQDAFADCALTEAQLAAALSFHFNTGAIHRADWVRAWKMGSVETAHAAFMNWRSPASIIPRREKERDLFFDGVWSNDGTTLHYDVRKPSYTPNWSSARRIDISGEVRTAIEAGV